MEHVQRSLVDLQEKLRAVKAEIERASNFSRLMEIGDKDFVLTKGHNWSASFAALNEYAENTTYPSVDDFVEIHSTPIDLSRFPFDHDFSEPAVVCFKITCNVELRTIRSFDPRDTTLWVITEAEKWEVLEASPCDSTPKWLVEVFRDFQKLAGPFAINCPAKAPGRFDKERRFEMKCETDLYLYTLV